MQAAQSPARAGGRVKGRTGARGEREVECGNDCKVVGECTSDIGKITKFRERSLTASLKRALPGPGNDAIGMPARILSGNPESFGNSVGSGWTYTHVFGTAGTYNYQCDPHAPMMSGTITVSETNNITYVIPSATVCDTIITLDLTISPLSLDLGADTLNI